jgi:hypothetical protein
MRSDAAHLRQGKGVGGIDAYGSEKSRFLEQQVAMMKR